MGTLYAGAKLAGNHHRSKCHSLAGQFQKLHSLAAGGSSMNRRSRCVGDMTSQHDNPGFTASLCATEEEDDQEQVNPTATRSSVGRSGTPILKQPMTIEVPGGHDGASSEGSGKESSEDEAAKTRVISARLVGRFQHSSRFKSAPEPLLPPASASMYKTSRVAEGQLIETFQQIMPYGAALTSARMHGVLGSTLSKGEMVSLNSGPTRRQQHVQPTYTSPLPPLTRHIPAQGFTTPRVVPKESEKIIAIAGQLQTLASCVLRLNTKPNTTPIYGTLQEDTEPASEQTTPMRRGVVGPRVGGRVTQRTAGRRTRVASPCHRLDSDTGPPVEAAPTVANRAALPVPVVTRSHDPVVTRLERDASAFDKVTSKLWCCSAPPNGEAPGGAAPSASVQGGGGEEQLARSADASATPPSSTGSSEGCDS